MKVASNLIKDIRKYYCDQLCSIYDKDEANAMILILFKHYFNIDRVKISLDPDLRLSESEMLKIHFAVKDLLKHKPIQYIVGETEFCDLKFKVNENVLIPRPETSEIVYKIVNRQQSTDNRQQTTDSRQQTTDNSQQTTDNRQQSTDNRQQTTDNSQQTTDNSQQTADSRQQTTDNSQQTTDSRQQTTVNSQQTTDSRQQSLSILDIGTGSGCIAISLAKMLPEAQVYALDISEKALNVAKENAEINNVNVTFIHEDILTLTQTQTKFDIIVSNPPYVRELEKAEMRDNVLKWEPHNALFVSNEDPLIFYRSILEFAKSHLKENGEVWFEINEYLGEEMTSLCKKLGFSDVKIYKDFRDRDRVMNLRI